MPTNRCVTYIFGLLAIFGSSVAFSEPVLIRTAFVVPVSNWAPMFVTECGMARARSEEIVHRLLQIHADVCGA
jgi:hypothetical protein